MNVDGVKYFLNFLKLVKKLGETQESIYILLFLFEQSDLLNFIVFFLSQP